MNSWLTWYAVIKMIGEENGSNLRKCYLWLWRHTGMLSTLVPPEEANFTDVHSTARDLFQLHIHTHTHTHTQTNSPINTGERSEARKKKAVINRVVPALPFHIFGVIVTPWRIIPQPISLCSNNENVMNQATTNMNSHWQFWINHKQKISILLVLLKNSE